jgi:basic amino acid/polyamine antiporter, APA family
MPVSAMTMSPHDVVIDWTVLRRSMGLVQSTAMVVGIIIGASIFVQPSEVSRHVSTVAGIFGVWLVAGVMTIAGARVCAELATIYSRTGGVYIYLKETISPSAAFLWGWTMFWVAHSGIIAAIAMVVARYAGFFANLDSRGVSAVAVAAVLALSVVNYLGVRPGGVVQTGLTAAKLLAILAILIAAAVLPHPAPANPDSGVPFNLRQFLLAVSAGLFAFGGWHMVTYAAEETHNPEKTIPRALAIGTMLVTACYLALNAAYLRVLPLERVLNSPRIAADAASVLVGPAGAAAISILVLVSSLGALNGIILAGPRVYFAMAKDGLAPRVVGEAHPRFQSPHAAIAAQAVWSCVLVLTGTYRSLFTRVVYTEWLFFGLMTFGLLRIRKRFIPAAALFLAACVLVVLNQFISDPKESAVGFLMVASGLPVYFLIKRKHADH